MTDQNAPLAASRRDLILDLLARTGSVRVKQLQDEFGVAPVTLRRDLQQLEEEGLLVRVHGGAVPPAGGMAPRALPTTATIGVLVPSLDFYWPQIVRSIEAAAREKGMSILLRGASYELQDERPALSRMLEQQELSGLIVAPNTDTEFSPDVIDWLTASGVPFVLAERDAVRRPTGEPVESVTTDHALGAVLAARHLAQLGHRKVGLLISRNSPTSRKIIAGWTNACRELGLTPAEHVERILPARTDPGFSAAVDGILDAVLAAGVTALLVHSDREAMAIVDLALAKGLSVPGDLSVIAYDDEFAELFTPALTGVAPPRAALGRAALDLLLARIADPARPAHRITLSPALNVRESTAPPSPLLR
ncbi:LacI family transcriptional regulator [Microbacterium sorbitolivorans]|uniref:DeoR family transcriptional regulator n=1 Tax=Microbacterium sorbitolivorans TaxID=1867410 RepID=A0A367Y366_9MICO|nr:substrate-binding domain-containing protein [Microbacterium sorbitolivorans]RCK60049.1 DeoR family transcriptional regulator [Microbacterium sorbitolivorans]GGF42276.1 LacI family transcriptional regulator [Microbacterium sorbitolivorans]